MNTIRLDIAPSVLQWVSSSYADKIDEGLTQKIQIWFSKEQKPTLTDIENLSQKTKVPFGYFFLNEPPVEDLPILEYRTIDSMEIANPSRELIDTISYIENVQSYMRDFRKDNGYDKNEVVGVGKNLSTQELTVRVRKILDIDKEWYKSTKNELFNFLRAKFEENGVIVTKNGIAGKSTKRALNYKEFRAFTMIDDYAPLIFINSTDTNNGQVFSLLHEFVHILLGESNFHNARVSGTKTDKRNEIMCNAITGEILVPHDIFITKWEQEQNIGRLASHFCCSEIVIARKALDNGYIKQDRYDEICKEVIRKAEEIRLNKDKDSGGDY